MDTLLAFIAGALMANGIPHFIKGIMGQTHMTPFKRVSSAELNVVYGAINFAVGLLLLNLRLAGPGGAIPLGLDRWVFLVGALLMALADANLFSKPNARLPWHKD
jgi:hypothetical protein